MDNAHEVELALSKAGHSHSIQGSWRGQYFYSYNVTEACGFEAVFVDIDGLVEGNILDDGYLGEALVGGSFHFPNLQFTKIYRGSHGVKYQGTMSEDGKQLHGRWHIPGSEEAGTWKAVRFEDGEDLKFEERFEKSKDLETVAPARQPERM